MCPRTFLPRAARIVAPRRDMLRTVHERLDIGEVFTTILATYRDQAALLLPAALAVFLPVAIINALIGSAGVALGVFLTVVSFAFSLIASFWYQGMVVEAARDMQDGKRDFDIVGLFRSVTPVLGALIGAGILAGLGIALGFVLLVVPGLVLLTWWAVVAPVVVMERPAITAALGRSRALVRGNGWPVFGVLALLVILQALLGAVIGALIGGLGGSGIGSALAGLIANVLVAPLSGLAAATMYLRLRRIHGEPDVPGGLRGSSGADVGPAPASGPPARDRDSASGASPPGADTSREGPSAPGPDAAR